MPDSEVRYAAIRRVLIITLFLNWAVAFAKIIYGFAIKSVSVSADGFHSLSDGTTNIICLAGIWIASRPKDAEHPYGHKKYETFTSMLIGGFLFFISFNILREVFIRFKHPVVPEVSVLSFVIMLVTLAINYFVMVYETKKGKQVKSDILITDALHTKTDIYSSISVIVALVAIKLGFPILDLIVGVVISVLIAKCAAGIFKESAYVLCDGSALDSCVITDVVKSIEGVKQCHKVRTRGRPDDVYVDLHVSVDTDMHVDKAHLLSHHIQDVVKKQVPGVTDVIVHIEPAEYKK